MRDLAILAVHFIATITKLLLPGGTRSVVSESLLLKHQILILNRSRARAPNLRPIDRIIASLCAGLMRPARLVRSAIVLKPSTLKTTGGRCHMARGNVSRPFGSHLVIAAN